MVTQYAIKSKRCTGKYNIIIKYNKLISIWMSGNWKGLGYKIVQRTIFKMLGSINGFQGDSNTLQYVK